MKNITVLGTGRVGSLIVADLSEDFNVKAIDIDNKSLSQLKQKYGVETVSADLSKKDTIMPHIKNCDLVVSAVPGDMGYNTLLAVLEAEKNAVDISFMPESFLKFQKSVRNNDKTIITDCGVAPGLANIVLGYFNSFLDINSYKCYVGGLPVERQWPFEYKAVFSPADVIEEYIRPAKMVIDQKIIVKEALSDTEKINFEGIGTLEAFNSDGLRSLTHTMDNIPNMVEKTLRYPGNVAYLEKLRHLGLFSKEEIEVKGVKVRPVDVTVELLKDSWELKPGDEDFTIMRLIVEGVDSETETKHLRYVYDLLDRFDTQNGFTSMARTTGYTCTAIARYLLEHGVERKGLWPAEFVAEEKYGYEYVINYLKSKNIVFKITKEER